MTGGEQARSLYCMSCGEEVPTYVVEVAGGAEIRCAPCGFTLETARTPLGTVLECIVLADDELLFRRLLSDLLVEEKVAKEVVGCETVPALLTECVRRFQAERPISLVILDIMMAPMDGAVAALALRALEKGLDRPAPVPILFLSGMRADDSLRLILENCGPALYLNKGKDGTPPRLARRLKELIPHLLTVRSG
jgi:CheY-like chemotaxis protein/DNA-directed RNA polymerase subunit RPC12/RpoP